MAGWQGERQIVFLTGEAGIGKTTLVDTFVAQVSGGSGLWIGHGQCIEQYGAGEAYVPLLSALGRLCRGPSGQRFTEVLQQHAPSWLIQMPALLSPDAGPGSGECGGDGMLGGGGDGRGASGGRRRGGAV